MASPHDPHAPWGADRIRLGEVPPRLDCPTAIWPTLVSGWARAPDGRPVRRWLLPRAGNSYVMAESG